jgi:Zn-dependent protease
MKWSYRIARIADTDVRIHVTFLLLPAYFGFVEWKTDGPVAAAMTVLFILILFLCVLLHEFGHALAGRHYGIRTPDITLLPIGGIAHLERIPEKPIQEFVIAIAGPAVNVAIAIAIIPALVFTGGLFGPPVNDFRSLLHNLLFLNLGLVLFNLIPAFPMDGGRIFRALLAMKLSWLAATRIAARTGQFVAILFAIGGFFWSPLLILIALFVFKGAQQELEYAKHRDELDQALPDMNINWNDVDERR